METTIQNFFGIFLELPYLFVDKFFYILSTYLTNFDAKTFNISLSLFSDTPIFTTNLYDLSVLVFSAIFVIVSIKLTFKFIRKIFKLFGV